MEFITDSHLRRNLSIVLDQVHQDQTPLLITRQNGKAVVMISLDEYNALEETAYLLRSPKNARRLMDSIEQLARNGN